MLGVAEPPRGEANMRSASEEPVPLHEEFIYCCGAATHVLKCGPWKDLSKDQSKNLPRLLFMIIPDYILTLISFLLSGVSKGTAPPRAKSFSSKEKRFVPPEAGLKKRKQKKNTPNTVKCI